MNDEDPVERCDREIAEIKDRKDLPAWVVALTVEDWEAEKRTLIARFSSERQGSVR